MAEEHAYVNTIKRYYQGCSTADRELMMSTFTDDVAHYFTHHAPIHGAENLATYWAKMQPPPWVLKQDGCVCFWFWALPPVWGLRRQWLGRSALSGWWCRISCGPLSGRVPLACFGPLRLGGR